MSKHEASTADWDQYRGLIRSRKGGWVLGKGVTSHGYSMLDELAGKASLFQVLILHVTGKLPERRLADWLDAIFICMSWPDPRIWPNHIGALGGTLRARPSAAICAGILAADSHIYGPGTLKGTVIFITETYERRQEGWSLEQIIDSRKSGAGQLNMPGYIRPLMKGDERVAAMQRVADELGFAVGPYLEFAFELQDVLYAMTGESINLGGYVAAFLLDQGYSADEIDRMCSMIVMAGVHACYAEAADNPPETFLPLRCDDIDYTGVPERAVPVK